MYPNDSSQFVRFKTTVQVLGIAALVRYTIPILESVGFNLNFTIPYSYTRVSESSDNGIIGISGTFTAESEIPYNYSSYSFGINISPGFQWFINNKIALLGTFGALSYTHFRTFAITNNNYIASSSANANDLKLSLTTGISFGATFYFGGKNSQIIPYSK